MIQFKTKAYLYAHLFTILNSTLSIWCTINLNSFKCEKVKWRKNLQFLLKIFIAMYMTNKVNCKRVKKFKILFCKNLETQICHLSIQ